MVKDEELKGKFMTKFDLGYVPKKMHMIFLYFLRMNQNITALHAKNINLKADVIRYLLKDFVNLKEFTLSFADGQPSIVGGGYGDIQSTRMYASTIFSKRGFFRSQQVKFTYFSEVDFRSRKTLTFLLLRIRPM